MATVDDLDPTGAQIDAAMSVLMPMAYGPVCSRDYVTDDSTGDERDRQFAAMRAADDEAEQLNRDLVRRALRAAANVPRG